MPRSLIWRALLQALLTRSKKTNRLVLRSVRTDKVIEDCACPINRTGLKLAGRSRAPKGTPVNSRRQARSAQPTVSNKQGPNPEGVECRDWQADWKFLLPRGYSTPAGVVSVFPTFRRLRKKRLPTAIDGYPLRGPCVCGQTVTDDPNGQGPAGSCCPVRFMGQAQSCRFRTPKAEASLPRVVGPLSTVVVSAAQATRRRRWPGVSGRLGGERGFG